MDGQKWSGNYPFGSAFTVNLRRIVGGKVQDAIVASGTVTKDHLQLGVAVLTDIYFTVPYNQTAGEALAFTVFGLSGGGMHGWNEFAMTSTNPYAGGTQFYSFSSSTVLPTSAIDLAFASITRPPAVVAEETIRVSHSDATGEYTIELPASVNGRSYVIEESVDLTTWVPGTTKMGTGGLLTWVIAPGVPRAFYWVKVQY